VTPGAYGVAQGATPVASLVVRASARQGGGHFRPPGTPCATRPLLLGTYTSAEGGGTGIGTATYGTGTGTITPGPVATGVENPSCLALHPSGSVTAFRVGPDGSPRRAIRTRRRSRSAFCPCPDHRRSGPVRARAGPRTAVTVVAEPRARTRGEDIREAQCA